METSREIAEKYFELSNYHRMEEIATMFTEETVYISANTGTYIGQDAIMDMMRPFHNAFTELQWDVHSIEETEPNTFLFDFTMTGTKKTGEAIVAEGLEYVTIKNETIARIVIQNK